MFAISGALLLGRLCHHSPDWIMGRFGNLGVGPKGEQVYRINSTQFVPASSLVIEGQIMDFMISWFGDVIFVCGKMMIQTWHFDKTCEERCISQESEVFQFSILPWCPHKVHCRIWLLHSLLFFTALCTVAGVARPQPLFFPWNWMLMTKIRPNQKDPKGRWQKAEGSISQYYSILIFDLWWLSCLELFDNSWVLSRMVVPLHVSDEA